MAEFWKRNDTPVAEPLVYSEKSKSNYIKLSSLTPTQKKMVWNYIIKEKPALAEFLGSADYQLLEKEFDAAITLPEEEVRRVINADYHRTKATN